MSRSRRSCRSSRRGFSLCNTNRELVGCCPSSTGSCSGRGDGRGSGEAQAKAVVAAVVEVLVATVTVVVESSR